MANSVVAQKGRNFLIKVSQGVSPTVFSTLGGLQATELKINGGAVDISNKGSGGWQEFLQGAGIKKLSLTGNGVFDASSREFQTLENAIFTDHLVEMEVISGAGDSFVATWSITELTRTGNHNAEEKYTLSIESSGFPVYSNPPVQPYPTPLS